MRVERTFNTRRAPNFTQEKDDPPPLSPQKKPSIKVKVAVSAKFYSLFLSLFLSKQENASLSLEIKRETTRNGFCALG